MMSASIVFTASHFLIPLEVGVIPGEAKVHHLVEYGGTYIGFFLSVPMLCNQLKW